MERNVGSFFVQFMDRGNIASLFKFTGEGKETRIYILSWRLDQKIVKELCCHLRSQLEICVAHNIP